MRFTPAEARIACDDLVRGSDSDREDALVRLTGQAAELLHRTGFVVFRVGALRLDVDESRKIAHLLTDRLCATLIARGAPPDMRVERDAAQRTWVPGDAATRTLLPHHDGQHCSYLTPSVEDDPGWNPAWREFGSSGYTTTPAHKMYQGIFLPSTGDGLSVTTYYDWVGVIHDVLARRGLTDAEQPVAGAARWLGRNLRTALDAQPDHRCPYPSLAGMLGVTGPLWNGISFHHAEAELSPEIRRRHPEAIPLAQQCCCGSCEGETARLFCHQVTVATGMTWSQFRSRWEVLAPGEHCDLLFGHNLTMLHGGWAGGGARIIEPLCLVVDEPRGPEYERWLAASWRGRLPDRH